jgi:hypothetical protein
MKKLTAEWIEKAEEDFFSAGHLVGAQGLTPYNVICFHCQQTGNTRNPRESASREDMKQAGHRSGA